MAAELDVIENANEQSTALAVVQQELQTTKGKKEIARRLG